MPTPNLRHPRPNIISEKGHEQLAVGEGIPPGTVWLDLFQPTPEEDRTAEGFLGASLPTREEAQEIEQQYADVLSRRGVKGVGHS